MSEQATIYYDGMIFNSASELESYIKIDCIVNGKTRNQSEINLIIQTAIEDSLDAAFEDDDDDRFVSLDEMRDKEANEEDFFESYDLNHETELNFN